MLKARKEIFIVCYTMLNIAVAAATSRLQSSDTWVPTVTQTMVWEARKQSVIISWQLFFSLPSSF